MCLSTGLPIPGSNTDGDLYDVNIYDIDYSYSSSVIADLQSKGKKVVCSLQRQIDHLACITLSSFFFSCAPCCVSPWYYVSRACRRQPCSSSRVPQISNFHYRIYTDACIGDAEWADWADWSRCKR